MPSYARFIKGEQVRSRHISIKAVKDGDVGAERESEQRMI